MLIIVNSPFWALDDKSFFNLTYNNMGIWSHHDTSFVKFFLTIDFEKMFRLQNFFVNILILQN